MVIGQDWGDVRYFKMNSGLESPSNPTSKTLRDLIALLGIDVGPPGDLGQNGAAFFTNAVLCLKKEGGLQAAVCNSWFENCRPFLKRQIEIVAPRLLVCVGERAYRNVAAAFCFRVGTFRKAVESEDGVLILNGTHVFPRYHCGRRILNTHRSLEAQRDDWLRLAKYL
jgi:uracil-DNA glycosylase